MSPWDDGICLMEHDFIVLYRIFQCNEHVSFDFKKYYKHMGFWGYLSNSGAQWHGSGTFPGFGMVPRFSGILYSKAASYFGTLCVLIDQCTKCDIGSWVITAPDAMTPAWGNRPNKLRYDNKPPRKCHDNMRRFGRPRRESPRRALEWRKRSAGFACKYSERWTLRQTMLGR